MSYRIKIPSKSTPPDEAQFLSGVERLWLLLKQRRREGLLGALVVILLISAIGMALWVNHRNAQAALELTVEATSLYFDQPVDKPKQAEEHLKQAITLYRQVVDQYPRSPSAPVALFRLGNALAHQGDADGAIKAYQRFLDQYSDHRSLVGMVYQRLGYAYLLKKDWDKAVQAFSNVLTIPGALNKDQILFELGKLEEARSQPEGALVRYQDLLKAYPNSLFAGEASARIKALGVKKGLEAGGTKDGGHPSEPKPARGSVQPPPKEPSRGR